MPNEQAEAVAVSPTPGTNSPKLSGCAAVLAVATLILGFIVWRAFRAPDPLGLTAYEIALTCAGFEEEDPERLYYDEEEGVFVLTFADRWQAEIKADGAEAPSQYAELEVGADAQYVEVAALFVASIISAVPGHPEHIADATAFVRDRWGDLTATRQFGDIRIRIDVYDKRVAYVRISGG